MSVLSLVFRNEVLLPHVEVADTPWRRMRGLLGRKGLPAGSALLLRAAGSIHTAGMRFPLDVCFLDGNDTVIRVVRGLAPWRMAWGGCRARSVLEMESGERAAEVLRPGDHVEWRSAGVP